MGASEIMLRWVRLLLRDTRASVHANGVESEARVWVAGVRQGCPLAPLLYLFIGQALTSWLCSKTQLGGLLGGRRSVSGQYADDTKADLSDCHAATVAILTDALQRFSDASGQHTHLGKSR
eukprot:1455-Chlamydomonas_euryale.AAC.1